VSGLLVIMGSGETAPTMVKPHRSIFDRVGEQPTVLLDTPYGFQSNADDISARAVAYFAASVGRTVDAVSWRTALPPGLARERALDAIRSAGWVFAGPGSPTYALRQWRDTPLAPALPDVVTRGGVLVMASAAALTLGSHTVPVYEIYKAGIEPYWEPGLDIVADVCGLPAVVIPHYDNAEGGHHDTRFCYLGEERLSTMEHELPKGSFILGVDEHTAVLLDPAARTASVAGNGTMTVRRLGRTTAYPSGSVVDFDALAAGGLGQDRVPRAGWALSPVEPVEPAPATSLRAAADEIAARFDAALGRRDADACVEAILALEHTLIDWAADTNQSDEVDVARAQLRNMVVRLGTLATVGARDPRSVVGPFVDVALQLRDRARHARDWATSDWIRDCLATAGVEVRDTPQGAQWKLSGPE
jgi:cyanophycinase-like exopeptidase